MRPQSLNLDNGRSGGGGLRAVCGRRAGRGLSRRRGSLRPRRNAPFGNETCNKRKDYKNNKCPERDWRTIKELPSQTDGIMRSVANIAAINCALRRNSTLIRMAIRICEMPD